MIVYHSAFQLKPEYSGFLGELQPRILRSFHGNKSTARPEWCPGLFLDSGAFSAFRSGAVIEVEKYIEFLHAHGDAFETYAGLDVIGDPKGTVRNQKIMDTAGLHAIPTFHVGSDFSLLRYWADRYGHIALGGMVPHSGTQLLKNWVRDVWSILLDYPGIKVHGFGLTDIKLSRMYPWYSIDSTTASRAGRTGVLVTPWGQLRVSSAITTKTGATIHTDRQIEQVVRWVNETMPDLDVTWEMLNASNTEASQLRICINARFLEMEVTKPLDPPAPSQSFGFT